MGFSKYARWPILGGFGALVITGFIAVIRPSASNACGNETERVQVPSVNFLIQSEGLASAGDMSGSLKALLAAEPRISIASAGMNGPKDRALRIAARVVARAKNAPFANFPSDEEQHKWAYLQVKRMLEKSPADPSLRTDFGEIASRIPSEVSEAKKHLEELEKDELMTSPFGYMALARLRHDAGKGSASVVGAPLRALEAGKRALALSRCRTGLKDPTPCDKGLVEVAVPATPAAASEKRGAKAGAGARGLDG